MTTATPPTVAELQARLVVGEPASIADYAAARDAAEFAVVQAAAAAEAAEAAAERERQAELEAVRQELSTLATTAPAKADRLAKRAGAALRELLEEFEIQRNAIANAEERTRALGSWAVDKVEPGYRDGRGAGLRIGDTIAYRPRPELALHRLCAAALEASGSRVSLHGWSPQD